MVRVGSLSDGCANLVVYSWESVNLLLRFQIRQLEVVSLDQAHRLPFVFTACKRTDVLDSLHLNLLPFYGLSHLVFLLLMEVVLVPEVVVRFLNVFDGDPAWREYALVFEEVPWLEAF